MNDRIDPKQLEDWPGRLAWLLREAKRDEILGKPPRSTRKPVDLETLRQEVVKAVTCASIDTLLSETKRLAEMVKEHAIAKHDAIDILHYASVIAGVEAEHGTGVCTGIIALGFRRASISKQRESSA